MTCNHQPNTKTMKKNEVKVGDVCSWGGYIVDVIEILPEGVVIECSEIGQEIVKASSLERV